VRWRIPFAHHPPFSAGPRHHNTKSMTRLLPLLQRSGVKAMFSGHEHNFQHSHHEGIDYFVTGGAGRTRQDAPNRFDAAHTASWSSVCHFLLVTIEGEQMTVRAVGEGVTDAAALSDIVRYGRDGAELAAPMLVRRELP
jgi:tartrate-resistant acid phosphatase type 5